MNNTDSQTETAEAAQTETAQTETAGPPGATPDHPGPKIEVDAQGTPVTPEHIIETHPGATHNPPTTPGTHGHQWRDEK